MIREVQKYDNFILDMDGVVYTGSLPVFGAKETIEELYRIGRNVKFLTNFPKVRSTIQKKLKDVVGLDVPIDDIMTVTYATVLYMMKNGREGDTVYSISSDDLKEEMRSYGLQLLETEEVVSGNRLKALPDWLVISLYDGDDFYRRLTVAGHILRSKEFNPQRYLATSQGFGWTREDGMSLGAGCTIAALKTFSDKVPTVIGKPSNILTDLAFNEWNIDPNESVMVGDKWSDVETANSYESFSVKVETGKQDFFKEIDSLPEIKIPDLVLKSINGLLDDKEIIYTRT